MSDTETGRGPTKIGEDDGGELVVMEWPEGGVEQALQAQIASTPQAGGTSPRRRGEGDTGPIQRTASASSLWQSVNLRSFSLNSTELATTLKRFRDEMYLNQFPVLLPGFVERCLNCGTEFDEEREACPVCGHDEFEPPSRKQKHWLADLVERVNDDGQSLRTLLKYEEDYQSFFGVSTLLVRLTYQHTQSEVHVANQPVTRDCPRWEPTDIDEVIHADPRQLVPVTDAQNRHGGWWTCPAHRDQYWEADALTFEADDTHPVEVCPECEARLEEVGYAELSGPRSQDVEQLFLKHEVIDWARHFPVMNGLDGRSPVLPLIKLQAILQHSRNYELQYLSPQNDQQLPDKFLVAYGKSIQSKLSASLNQEESKNPWEEGRLTYNGNPDDVEVDILDLSSSAGINGREPMVERLMSQVRAMFGMTDAFENELSDAGGLNAEGTQVEITNHAVASAHQDTKDQALDALCRIVAMIHGSCDWELGYVDPKRAEETLSPVEVLDGIATAQQAGVSVSVEDGTLHIPDQQIDATAPSDRSGPGGDKPADGPEQSGQGPPPEQPQQNERQS